MAKTVESKKRKASVPESGAVKVKKVKQVVEATSAPAPVAAKKRKATETAIDVPEVKKSKKVTKAALPDEKSTTEALASERTAKKTSDASKPAKAAKKATKITKKVAEEPEEEAELAEENGAADSDEEGSEIDDQTEALLKGFESDGDDNEPDGEGLEEGAPVPEVKLTKGQKKALKKAQEEADGDKPGVLFISRIPHGFFEHQMKEYFGQFGTILQLRLSRNKATGASKHYAFIQFESATVAEIVAKTMDNYLLFSHILKVKVVADEAVPANVWKGAGKRFKNIPRNKMAGRKLKLPATEEIWDKRAANVQEKREAKAAKLKEMGYEIPLPKIKSAKGLAKEHTEAPSTVEAPEPAKAIEDVPAETEPTKSKKGKKAKNEPVQPETETPTVEAAKPKNPPKVKKTKETKVTKIETVEVVPEEAPEEEASKPKKKGKKAKVVEDVSVAEEAPAPAPAVEEKPKRKGKKANAVAEVAEVAEENVEKAKKPKKGKKAGTA